MKNTRSSLLLVPLLTATASLYADTPSQTLPVQDDGYPAPPGVYGNPLLLEQIKALQPEQSQQPPTTPATVAEIPLPAAPVPAQNLPLMPLVPADKPEVTAAPLIYLSQPQPQPQQNFTQYPDAGALKQQMNEASQFEFSQWGFDDTGSQTANMQESAFEYGPEMFFEAENYNRYFDNPYPVSSQPPVSGQNLYTNDYQNYSGNSVRQQPRAVPDSHYPVPNNYQYGYDVMQSAPASVPSQLPYTQDNYGRLPANPYAAAADSYPVPESVYGTKQQQPDYRMTPQTRARAPDYNANLQYFRQIPEEEIIYPAHYPGRR